MLPVISLLLTQVEESQVVQYTQWVAIMWESSRLGVENWKPDMHKWMKVPCVMCWFKIFLSLLKNMAFVWVLKRQHCETQNKFKIDILDIGDNLSWRYGYWLCLWQAALIQVGTVRAKFNRRPL